VPELSAAPDAAIQQFRQETLASVNAMSPEQPHHPLHTYPDRARQYTRQTSRRHRKRGVETSRGAQQQQPPVRRCFERRAQRACWAEAIGGHALGHAGGEIPEGDLDIAAVFPLGTTISSSCCRANYRDQKHEFDMTLL
jgi:hypothetical protein